LLTVFGDRVDIKVDQLKTLLFARSALYFAADLPRVLRRLGLPASPPVTPTCTAVVALADCMFTRSIT